MILPLVPPSPATPGHGTAAIRCGGRSTGGADFEALLAQAAQIGSDIAALIAGSSMTAGLPSPLPPAGVTPTSAGGPGGGAGPWIGTTNAAAAAVLGLTGGRGVTGAAALNGAAAGAATLVAAATAGTSTTGVGAATGSSDGVASALAGLTLTDAHGTAQASGAAVGNPAAQHPAEGSGHATLPGTSLPPGLAARLADGRLSPDALPGQHGDGHPGRGIDGGASQPATVRLTATPATAATPADPATATEPGVAPANPATPAVPAVPAEGGNTPASEVPADLLTAGPVASRRGAAPAHDTRSGAPDGRVEPGAATHVANGPAGPHLTAASEAPETAAALPVRIAELARRRSGTTEQVVVRLDPPELGSVRISLTARGDQVHVVVRADTPEARAALDAQRGNVEQLLRDAGFDLSSFDVGHQRREHERHGSRGAGPQPRFAADLLDLPDTSARAADGALRL